MKKFQNSNLEGKKTPETQGNGNLLRRLTIIDKWIKEEKS
jgi:hypothetical protein